MKFTQVENVLTSKKFIYESISEIYRDELEIGKKRGKLKMLKCEVSGEF